MKEAGKYQPLHAHLRRSGEEQVTLSFTEIEALLGSALPGSARTSRAWWSNRSKGALQAATWMSAGYHVMELDLAGERVTFRRLRPIYNVRRTGETGEWDGEAIRDLRRRLQLSQAQLAEELGVRQQTVSEWENSAYTPTRAMSKLLTMVAERAEHRYMEGD